MYRITCNVSIPGKGGEDPGIDGYFILYLFSSFKVRYILAYGEVLSLEGNATKSIDLVLLRPSWSP